jgi:two-component sensor histidine kinase
MTAAGETVGSDTARSPAPPQPQRRLPLAGRRWEAADAVVALTAALVFVIAGIFVLLCIQGYQQTISNARDRAQTTADVVASQADWLLGGGFTALRLIESKLAFEPAILDPGEKADLDAAVDVLPGGASFAIYDPNGAVLENGGSASLPSDISQEPYFLEVTTTDKAETVAPQQADPTTGEPRIVLARRLGTGVISGVAVLSLPMTNLAALWTALKMPEGSTVSLIREDGWIVGRYPLLPQTMNMTDSSPFWPQVKAEPAGAYDSGRSPADGIARLVGFTHLPQYGVVAFGSVATETALGGLWTSIWIVTALLLPVAIALLVGSLWTARLLRRSAQTQRTLQAAVAHNEVLFREIHHRVKNNLQSVASLLQMQPIPREIKANMGQRIAAMSAVHEHIYRSGNFETVHVKDYLSTLIASIRAGHDPNVRVIEELDDLPVDREAATPLGLILNEVASNAFKHAFADGREGVVTVRLARTPEGRGQLTVEDNGLGFDPQTPTKGIGRRLIGALTQQINGESRFETAVNGGSLFTLTFPLASQETPPSATPLR